MAILATRLRFLDGGRTWLAVILAWGVFAPVAPAQTAATGEYELKAVFLFNFARFVEWPAAAFPGPEAPLVIGVLGDDPFGPLLDEIVRGEKIGSHPLLVRRYRRIEEIGDCHILFIGAAAAGWLGRLPESTAGRSILTVSDADSRAVRGVMIRFLTAKNKIKLRINLEAAKAASLTFSSKLLRPAEIVPDGES